MSVKAISWAYEQNVKQPGAKFVLVSLANYADENGFCYPSQRTIARMTAQSERTVRGHLKQLEEDGFIKRDHRYAADGQRTSDGYDLLAPAESLRQNLPVVKGTTGNTTGKKQQHYRQNLPLAESAANTSVESAEPSVEPSHTQQQTDLRAEGAPAVAVCGGSKFTFEECRKYARHLQSTGQGINNPGGYATTIKRTGEADELIGDYLNRTPRQVAEARSGTENKNLFYGEAVNKIRSQMAYDKRDPLLIISELEVGDDVRQRLIEKFTMAEAQHHAPVPSSPLEAHPPAFDTSGGAVVRQ